MLSVNVNIEINTIQFKLNFEYKMRFRFFQLHNCKDNEFRKEQKSGYIRNVNQNIRLG